MRCDAMRVSESRCGEQHWCRQGMRTLWRSLAAMQSSSWTGRLPTRDMRIVHIGAPSHLLEIPHPLTLLVARVDEGAQAHHDLCPVVLGPRGHQHHGCDLVAHQQIQGSLHLLLRHVDAVRLQTR